MKYFFFSKFLSEAVSEFGLNGKGKWSKDINNNNKWIGTGEPGPFFCGISVIMHFPQFAIYLSGPCSTTKQEEIACNFAGETGIIIKLQNDTFMTKLLGRFFDCSFISNYVEEDERLWINTGVKLRMQTIKMVKSGNNYKQFFHAFYCLDALLSSEFMYDS
eukprot:188677_1